jgi:hypothetical protein
MTQWQPDETNTDNNLPAFTQAVPGGSDENFSDESDILSDQDETEKFDLMTDDEKLGAHSKSLDSSEDEPDDFMEGKLDVKAQMDRAAQEMVPSDSPRSELGSAFANTPGGVDEVAMRTDQELARRHHPVIEKHKH